MALIRSMAKDGPDRTQVHSNVECALPIKIEKDWYTLIEQSNVLLNLDCALPTGNSAYVSV